MAVFFEHSEFLPEICWEVVAEEIFFHERKSQKYSAHQMPFFWKNIFSNFFIYLKVQAFQLIMENNFIQMATSAGHALAYTIGPILKHIIDFVKLRFTNDFTNIVL